MRKVAGYLSNVGKSITYSAIDKVKETAPSTAEFIESNSELYKSVYDNIRNFRTTYSRGVNTFKKSKVYEASDILKSNIIEDISSGKFYNKDRDSSAHLGMGGGDSGNSEYDFNDLDFDMGDDSDWGNLDDVTTGDRAIVQTVNSSNRKTAEVIASVTARSSEYIVENQRMATNLTYTQQLQTQNIISSGLNSVNENISGILNFTNGPMTGHFKNSTDYYTKSTELLQDQTALLRRIADAVSPLQQEKKTKDKTTYNDIVGANGTPDMTEYYKNVKQNLANNSTTGLLSSMSGMFGEDSNMLAVLAENPLQFIPKMIVNTITPKVIESSMAELDKSISGVFSSAMVKLNTMSTDPDSNPITKTIASILGIRSSSKNTLNANKYNKGKVDWNGKSEKALVEVIPTQLSKIISLMSGTNEKVYDYEQGSFVDIENIKKSLDDKNKNYAMNAGGDMLQHMKDYMKVLSFDTQQEQERMMKDMEVLFTSLFENNKLFDVNSKSFDEDHMDYGIDAKNFRVLRAMFNNAPNHMKHQLNADILYNRQNRDTEFNKMEEDGNSVFTNLFNGNKINEFITKDKLTNKTYSKTSDPLVVTKDNKGRNIFYYLQNMYRELSYMRQHGGGGPRGVRTNAQFIDPITTATGNEDDTPLFSSVQVPNVKMKTPAEEASTKRQKDRDKYIQRETRRRDKDKDLVNVSELDDYKDLENHVSAAIGNDMRFTRYKETQLKEKTVIEKLLEAKDINEKTNVLTEKISKLYDKPITFVTDTIKKVDKRLYELIYGTKTGSDSETKGFLDLALWEMKKTFSSFNTFLDEKILTPLKEKLGVDSVKDIGKKTLGFLGIDTDAVKESIKNIFKNVGESVKDTLVNVFSGIKNSVSNVASPIWDKTKGFFKSKPKKDKDPFKDKEDEFEESVNPVTGKKEKVRRTQYHYQNLSTLSDQDLSDNIKKFEEEKGSLEKEMSVIEELQTNRKNLEFIIKNNKNNPELEKYIKQQDSLDLEIKEKYKQVSQYEDYKNNLDISKKKNNTDNMSNYLLDGITNIAKLSPEGTNSIKALLNKMIVDDVNDSKFGDLTKLNNLTIEDLINTSYADKNGDKDHINPLNSLLEYADKNKIELEANIVEILGRFHSSAIDLTESNTAEDVVTTQEDNNTWDELYYENNIEQLSLTQIISDTLGGVKDIASEILSEIKGIHSKDNTHKQVGPLRNKVGLNNIMMNHPEGAAIHGFAGNLVNNISNWMWENTTQFDEGGYVSTPMVATVGKGEVVLSKDNVDRLTGIFNDLMTNIGKKAKSKELKVSLKDALSDLDIDGISSTDAFSEFITNNESLNVQVSDKSVIDRTKYKNIINDLKREEKKAIKTQNKPVGDSEESLTDQIKEVISNDFKDVKDALFGSKPEDEKKNFGTVIDDLLDNANIYAPKMLTSGLVGGGISLLTGAIGGPLLGAAVGAGISLTKNSDKVQDAIFGPKDSKGERVGGIVSKDLFKGIAKYLPDMKSYGITGALAGFLTPLGPIGGLLLGSSIGFAKNNESIMGSLFGEEGLFKPESKDKFAKTIPKVAGGALAAGMMGPFGLMGNLLLGSSLGLVASTNEFKQALLGRYDEKNKKFKGGILPTIRDTFVEPMKDFAKEIKDNLFDNIKKNIFAPITSAFDPIKKEIQLKAKGMFNSGRDFFAEMFEKHIGNPITKAIEDKLIKPLSSTLGKAIRFMITSAGDLISAPFKAIGMFGNGLRKKHIKSGDADYMTAEERLKYSDKNNVFYENTMDKSLASMDTNQAKDLLAKLQEVKSYSSSTKDIRKQIARETGDNVSTYLDSTSTKDVMAAIKRGDLNKALAGIDKKTLFGNKRNELNEDEDTHIREYIKHRFTMFNDIDKKKDDVEATKGDLFKQLSRQFGFKVTDRNIDSIIGNVEKESRTSKVVDDNGKVISEDPMVNFMYEEGSKRHDAIFGILQETLDSLRGVKENTDKIEDNQITETEDNKRPKRRRIGNKDVSYFDTDGDGDDDNPTDPDTVAAENEAEEERESKLSLFERLKNTIPFGKNKKGDNEEDGEGKKKGGLLKNLFSLAKSNIGKVLLGGGAAYLGVTQSDKIFDVLGNKVLPAVSDIFTNVITPWFQSVGVPLIQNGIVGFVKALPGAIGGAINFALTDLLPTILYTVGDMFGLSRVSKKFKDAKEKHENKQQDKLDTAISGFNEENGIDTYNPSGYSETGDPSLRDDMLLSTEEDANDYDMANTGMANSTLKTMGRQVATGGRLGTLGIPAMGKIANKMARNKAAKKKSLGSKLMNNLNPIKAIKNIMLLPGTAAKTVAVGGTKIATEGAIKAGTDITKMGIGGMNNIYNAIDSKHGNILGVAGNKLKSKFGIITKATGTVLSTTTGSNIDLSQYDVIIKNIMSKFKEMIVGIVSNPKVSALVGKEASANLMKKIPKFLKSIYAGIVKSLPKFGGRIAGSISTGGILNIVFAVTDFISGYNNAKDMLSITEDPNMAVKVACGITKSLKNFFIIGCLMPDELFMDIVFDFILDAFGKNDGELSEMRKEAQSKVDNYKKENGITSADFNVQDYNKAMKKQNQKNNPKDANGDGKESILDIPGRLWNWAKSGASKVMNAGSNLWDSVKDFGSNLLFGKGAGSGPVNTVGMGPNCQDASCEESAGMGDGFSSVMNGWRYYNQGDDQWNKETINGISIKKAGCGPSSIAMLLSQILNRPDITPVTVAKEGANNKFWTKEGADWRLFKSIGNSHGIDVTDAGSSFGTFETLAKQGIPQAVSGKGSAPFTRGGHIITVLGADEQGNAIVNDPASTKNTRIWKLDELKKNGWRNSWGFGGPITTKADMNPNVTVTNNGEVISSPNQQAEVPKTGLDQLFSDLSGAMSKTFDKTYGFDRIGQLETQPDQSDSNSAGMGPDEEVTLGVNPLAATDFVGDISLFNKVKSIIKKTKVDKYINKPTPKTSKRSINKTKKKINKIVEDGFGQGGVDSAAQTYKTVKGVALGTKALGGSISQYEDAFKKAGTEFGADPDLLKAIAMQESSGNPNLKGPADGMMQIEDGATTNEFITFGKNRPDGPYTANDRYNPNKAIPFAASRVGFDFKKYNGDYFKTTQAYNWSRYSLDALLKHFPNGDDWLDHRNDIGKYNGTGAKKYGDPKYIPNVLKFYHGNTIPSDGVGTVVNGTVVPEGTTGVDQQQQEQRSGFDGFMQDVGDLFSNSFNKLYGLDEILGVPESESIEQDGQTGDPEVSGTNIAGSNLNTSADKVADTWFIDTMKARMSSGYGNRWHPTKKVYKHHDGIDYAAPSGTDIFTPVDGTVTVNKVAGGYGNLLQIKDNKDTVHTYGHLVKRSHLTVGTKVKSGDHVADVGTTGTSTGNHLHYGVKTTSGWEDPNTYLRKFFTTSGPTKANSDKLNNNKPTNTATSNKPSTSLMDKLNGKGGVDSKAKKVPSLKPIIRSYRDPLIGKDPVKVNDNPPRFDKQVLSLIVKLLSKISDNTGNLNAIVKLLSECLCNNHSQQTVTNNSDKKKLQQTDKSNQVKNSTTQVVNLIRNAVQEQGQDPETMYLFKELELLAFE